MGGGSIEHIWISLGYPRIASSEDRQNENRDADEDKVRELRKDVSGGI